MEPKLTDPLKQNILEAVECLRQRKCRPDRESIAHYVLRKFGSTMNEIFAELENIVDANGLIKVEYKGTTSYRSPSSFDTKNSPLLTKHSKILNSSKTTRFILTGINELLAKDSTYAQVGVPLDELKEKLVEFDNLRFTEETTNVLLERETNCGGIHIGKSEYLGDSDSLRVFPKDIPVPTDMRIISLISDSNPIELEEKKPRKTRKSNVAGQGESPDGPEPKKGRKPKIKQEIKDDREESIFAVKSDPGISSETETDLLSDDTPPPPNKKGKITPIVRKIVAEKVAEVVRKTYESTTEFETTSAQMIKLAEAVVNKQTEEPSVQKVPLLVLAESVSDHRSDDVPKKVQNSDSTNSALIEADAPTNEVSGAGKRKGRASAIKQKDNASIEKAVEQKDSQVKQNLEPSPENQGLTRSKRDKRKKQVFDPSDLPKTYTTYSTTPKANKRASIDKERRLSEAEEKNNSTIKRGRKSASASATVDKDSDLNNSKKCVDKKALMNLKPSPIKSSPRKNSTSRTKEDITDDPNEPPPDITEEEGDKVGNKNEISSSSESNSTPLKSETLKSCEYCHQSNKKDGTEELLTCSSCRSNTHPSCMDYSPELSKRIMQLSSKDGGRDIAWQCFDCKTCGACQEKIMCSPTSSSQRNGSSGNGGVSAAEKRPLVSGDKDALKVILCEHCDVGFHLKCTGEHFNTKASLNEAWVCQQCKEDGEPTEGEESPSISKTKSGRIIRKPQPRNVVKSTIKAEATDDSVDDEVESELLIEEDNNLSELNGSDDPEEFEEDVDDPDDIRVWSTSDVETFFVEKGLKDEATILRQQEVDGCSLLLLQREDIINGMGFRLGPALKVYRLIYELQSKAPVQPAQPDDPKEAGDAPNHVQR